MKKIIVLVLAVSVLSGCASFWNMMGAGTIEGEQTLQKHIVALEKSLDELSAVTAEIAGIRAAAEEAKLQAGKVEEVSKALIEIQSRLDSLPQETLVKLSEILAKAVAELPPPETAAPPVLEPAK